MTLNREIKFQLSQCVVRRCDEDKRPYYVTQILVDEKDVLYKISGMDGYFIVYHFEIVDYAERYAVQD